ncbi:MAG: hypothetical protein ACPGQS_04730, partial [Bradymonadia bacterium]
GWIDSSPLGAHSTVENNGFDRSVTGLPTTDVERMVRFFEGELARRGVTREQYEGATPVGGPLYTQSLFEPDLCENGEGVDIDGTVTWNGGDARYIYILRDGSDNPGVPPNRDEPEGTLWKLDVNSRTAPIASGLRYGSTPNDTFQRIPADGDAPALETGSTYYIYVLADVGSPITRCIFQYEGPNQNMGQSSTETGTPSQPAPIEQDWNKVCTADSDCAQGTDYCVKMPGAAEGYCSVHCNSTTVCLDVGAPEGWTCNAVSCAVEDFTWCGPAEEIEESGNFLSVCE